MMAIENRRDDDNGCPTRASIVAPPGGTFLALDNDGGNAGNAVGKARGRAEDGGVANAGLDGLLSVTASNATATSSYSRSAGVDDDEVASGRRHRPTMTMTVADAVSIDDDEATNEIAAKGTNRAVSLAIHKGGEVLSTSISNFTARWWRHNNQLRTPQ
jgi:branched-subunit amino acid aminotransferase/4-amino-4-deoxychorismate lyase